MTPEQHMRMMQQMGGDPSGRPQQQPEMQKKPQKQVFPQKPQPWYDRFGWWTVLMAVIASVLAALAYLPPLK